MAGAQEREQLERQRQVCAQVREQLESQRQVCAQVRRRCEARRQMIALARETLALQTEKYSSFHCQHSDKSQPDTGQQISRRLRGEPIVDKARIQEHCTLSHFPNTALPKARTSAYDVVALAASLGGVRALSQILEPLPPDFPAAITVVQHLEPQRRSLLADILSRRTALTVKQAESGDQLRPGTVYIAPPNKHLLVNPDGTLSLSQSEQVHFARPSADRLFESVAVSFKERAIAVILTGRDGDGSMGVRAIKKMGGTVIAQDQATSEAFGMPSAAIETGSVDLVRPLNQIASVLVTLVMAGKAA